MKTGLKIIIGMIVAAFAIMVMVVISPRQVENYEYHGRRGVEYCYECINVCESKYFEKCSLSDQKIFLHEIQQTWPDLMLERINLYRNKKLKMDSRLSESAYNKARKLKDFYLFEHDLPGVEFDKYFRESCYMGRYLGENLARGIYYPELVVDKWMGSESHKRILMSEQAEVVGFGIIDFKISPDADFDIMVVLHVGGMEEK